MKHFPAALPATLAVVLLVLTPLGFEGGAAQAAFPGQNGRFAVYSGQDIWVADADGTNLTRLTAAPGFDRSPRWVARRDEDLVRQRA
jgi:hypothetical protein